MRRFTMSHFSSWTILRFPCVYKHLRGIPPMRRPLILWILMFPRHGVRSTSGFLRSLDGIAKPAPRPSTAEPAPDASLHSLGRRYEGKRKAKAFWATPARPARPAASHGPSGQFAVWSDWYRRGRTPRDWPGEVRGERIRSLGSKRVIDSMTMSAP